jgi:ATP-dependent DNA ligase
MTNGKIDFVLPRIRPMRLRLVKEPFDNPDYVFELKHDGFRAVIPHDNGIKLQVDVIGLDLTALIDLWQVVDD